MKPVVKAFLVLVILAIAAGAGVVAYVATTGMSARGEPGAIEAFLARNLRNLAIARRARQLSNPIDRAPDVIAAGRAHFADHCAVCHDNNGSGNTMFGRGMWPKPPDLRKEQTQQLSDGEIFYIIEHGVRFSLIAPYCGRAVLPPLSSRIISTVNNTISSAPITQAATIPQPIPGHIGQFIIVLLPPHHG